MAKERWQTRIEELREDNRSGASEIASQALDLLIDAVGDSVPASAISYRRWLLRISRDLVAAQPAMALLFRLVNDMLWAADEPVSAEEMRRAALDFLQAHRASSAESLDALAMHAGEYLKRQSAVMTHSRSATVLGVLTRLKELRGSLRVYCGEGRPMLEGQTLASELAWAGIEVVIGVDMALFSWLPEAQSLLVGADSLMADGLVNKLGTHALMHRAYELEIPNIVVCTTDKFLPNDYVVRHSLREGAAEEIMPVSNDNITVRNPYFDVTPLDLVSAVITEKGVLAGLALDDELEAIQTYPGLRGTA
jgi:translation initiation factor 2B subunit (eIF-2B alpha/beta/delta family)